MTHCAKSGSSTQQKPAPHTVCFETGLSFCASWLLHIQHWQHEQCLNIDQCIVKTIQMNGAI